MSPLVIKRMALSLIELRYGLEVFWIACDESSAAKQVDVLLETIVRGEETSVLDCLGGRDALLGVEASVSRLFSQFAATPCIPSKGSRQCSAPPTHDGRLHQALAVPLP